jgi:hypothetical protein
VTAVWPFPEPARSSAWTTKRIVAGGPVLAIHHEDDGQWQFVDEGPFEEEDAAFVHLGHFVEHHPWVVEFADLPIGWMAYREDPTSPWQRGVAPTCD